MAASRARPRDMRFQNPGARSCGSAPTTASTVCAGASAITVYTVPRLAQVRDRRPGSATNTACPATLAFRQPGSLAGRAPCCSNTETMARPSE
jgi:hypothetical protein